MTFIFNSKCQKGWVMFKKFYKKIEWNDCFKGAIEWKTVLPWHSWIITVLYMEMAYREPQTPLFPPPYVNLVNAKDHWKIGESEHNTDCDVTVGITNSYVPNICIYPPSSRPAACRIIRSSASIVKKQARTTEKMADHGNKCYVPGCAGDVKCRDGLVSVFRKATESVLIK